MADAGAPAANGGGAPHLLVVDDDARLRELLRRFLAEQGYRVTAAEDAAEARRQFRNFRFDLAVIDVMMPGESGLALCASLRHVTDMPILLLTARADPADRIMGLEQGADDYLAKPFEPRELLLRIQSILRRARDQAPPGSPAIAPLVVFGPFVFDAARRELRRDGAAVKLTGSEVALLAALARRPHQPVSREDLARETGAGSDRAIDVQVTRLRRKIEDDPRSPVWLHTVWGEGYVLRPEG